MKILITGCRGQLGTELQHQLSAEGCAIGPLPERLRKATVIPVDVDELDITDREATINYIRRHQPDTVINCAAFTNVDGCETARADFGLRPDEAAGRTVCRALLPPALHCAHGMALQQLRQKLRQDDDPSGPDPR